MAARLRLLELKAADLGAVLLMRELLHLLRRGIGLRLEAFRHLVEAVDDAPGEAVGVALKARAAEQLEQRADEELGCQLCLQRIGHLGGRRLVSAADLAGLDDLLEGGAEVGRRGHLGIELGQIGKAAGGHRLVGHGKAFRLLSSKSRRGLAFDTGAEPAGSRIGRSPTAPAARGRVDFPGAGTAVGAWAVALEAPGKSMRRRRP